MRFFGFLLAGVLLTGSSASAQGVTSHSLLVPSSTNNPIYASDSSSAASQPVSFRLPAVPAPAAKPQGGVVGVYEHLSFQAYVGYTFMRFYEAPHLIRSLNGFDSSLTYYFHSSWLAADGDFFGAFGSQSGSTARLALGAGGLRARWSAPRGLEFWAHGLAGRAHFVPQTAFGPQGAFAYDVGIGVDATGHRQRLAYRLQLDMVGSKFFGTYQLSPKASLGVVYKF